MSPYAVLFDLDDTLYPEHTYVLSGFRAVARYLEHTYGAESLSVYTQLASDFKNGVRGNAFDLVLERFGIPKPLDIVPRLLETYRTHKPQIELYPDAAHVLLLLRSYFRLGLLTDGYSTVQRNKVHALGIKPFFSSILYSDDLGRAHWKPSLLPFQRLLSQLEVQPTRAVYIGDNPKKDFIGARKLGLTTIRVKKDDTEHGDHIAQPGFEADFDLTTLRDLPRLLSEIFYFSFPGCNGVHESNTETCDED